MNIVKQCRYGNMILNRRDSWVGDSLDIYGEFSESEVEVFRQHIKEGDIVLDVGANIGSHTVVLSQLVGERGLVYAFEPERYNYYTLCGNLALNNIYNVVAIQNGISNKLGVLNVPFINVPQNTNYGNLELDRDYAGCPTYAVPCTTLDSLNLQRCDFIKMDVEGMEKTALEGAVSLIEKFKPVLYLEDDRENKSEALRDFVKKLGYTITEHHAPLFNPSNFKNEKHNVFGKLISKNILCL